MTADGRGWATQSRRRGGCLRALVVIAVLVLLLLVVVAVVVGVLLIANADAVLSWLNSWVSGVVQQIQQLPFLGA